MNDLSFLLIADRIGCSVEDLFMVIAMALAGLVWGFVTPNSRGQRWRIFEAVRWSCVYVLMTTGFLFFIRREKPGLLDLLAFYAVVGIGVWIACLHRRTPPESKSLE